MSKPTFAASARADFGSKAAQRYRAEGKVPLTVSRSGADSVHLLVDVKDAEELKKLESRVVLLQVEGGDRQVLVKKGERDALTDQLLQIDAIEVADDQVVQVAVAVHADTNVDCPGLKAGGLLEQMLRKVTIRCAAVNIPDFVSVDLTGVKLSETVYASAAQLPEGATLITRPRTAMMTIIKTRGMRRAEAAADGEE
ncbi:MAG: 50S ribosomal protein L25 [Planctomycetota bacterium]|jgi:large subunit ribosomal protein L25